MERARACVRACERACVRACVRDCVRGREHAFRFFSARREERRCAEAPPFPRGGRGPWKLPAALGNNDNYYYYYNNNN